MDSIFWAEIWSRIGVGPYDVVSVVVSTLAIYAAFVGLVRLLGQRTLARLGGFDVAVVVAFGAITGRVTLGYTPTLAAGVIALLTLFAAEAVVGELRRLHVMDRLFDNRARVLVVDGVVHEDLLRRSHLLEDELQSSLRRAGVARLSDVALVVLERTGELSVLRRGVPIDPVLVQGLQGRERVPSHLLADGTA